MASSITRERFEAGLAPLGVIAEGVGLARVQSGRMADRGELFHNPDLQADVAAFAPDWQGIAENVGYGPDVGDVHARFMASPPHRANILGDYSYVGTGTVIRDGRVWVTVVFLKAPRGRAVLTRIPLERIGLPSNIDQAVEASRRSFADHTANAVVVARDDAYSDALAGGPLAAGGRGPLLLARTADVPDAVVAEAGRVLEPGGTVYLMGGTAALSPAVEERFRAAGLVVQRIAGNNRFETAALVAPLVNPNPSVVLLVSGAAFADAMSATPAASVEDAPILLAERDSLPQATLGYLATVPVARRIVVGGTAAISDATAAVALAAERVAGADRYDTAVQVAKRWFPTASRLVLVSGSSFQDSAVAGALASGRGEMMLMSSTPPDRSTFDYVRSRLEGLGGARVIGTSDEVGDATTALLLT